MTNKFCVYVHCRKTDNTVFYVGKGTEKRARSASFKSRSEYWGRIVKKHGFYPVILYKNLSEESAFQIEKSLIAEIGRDKLCNLTDGGEGTTGRTYSEHTKIKMSKTLKGKAPSDKTILASIKKNSKPVGTVCGLRFSSSVEAAKYIRENAGVSSARNYNILKSANGIMKNAYGFEFRFIDENGNLEKSRYVNKSDSLKKAVRTDTGLEFESIIDACNWLLGNGIAKAKDIRTVSTNIKSSIIKRGKSKTAYGFNWSFVDA